MSESAETTPPPIRQGESMPTTNPSADEAENQIPSKQCIVCSADLETADAQVPFIYPCLSCDAPYCVGCLRSMFNSACKDESSMPPRCCAVIPLNLALPYLAPEEVTLYKLKYEEWSTPNRFYCPIPTCSTFIPARLLPTLPKPSKAVSIGMEDSDSGQQAAEANGNGTFSDVPDRSTVIHQGKDESVDGPKTEHQLVKPVIRDGSQPGIIPKTNHDGVNAKPEAERGTEFSPLQISSTTDAFVDPSETRCNTILCPNCNASICCSCENVHPYGSPCIGPDEAFEALLQRFNIKRCPKCRAGVRRMYGCSHMRCRCNAQWCWGCLEPIEKCGGCCDEEDGDYESGASDDLDCRDAGGDFGDEPSHSILDPWNCAHQWERVRLDSSSSSGKDGEMKTTSSKVASLDCHRCWTSLHPSIEIRGDENESHDAEAGTQNDTRRAQESTHDSNKGKSPARKDETTPNPSEAWQCQCQLILCTRCKDDDVSSS
ncbi:MAG: hypothetical protein M1837_004320 [Sclerophora amabilis]|nr:MAG: hypothetical protein M1837_004320 [Sclerophora amabilis]